MNRPTRSELPIPFKLGPRAANDSERTSDVRLTVERPPTGPGVAKTQFPSVQAFERLMLEKLRLRVARHGGPGSWYRHTPTELLSWLHREVAELEEALDRLEFSEADPGYERSVLVGQVARECADVANLAMMLADVIGGLGAA